MKEQRIVCAANRNTLHPDIVVCGARHFDMVMHSIIGKLPSELKEGKSESRSNHGLWEQGFIDNRGQFLTRQEALKVAKQGDQLIQKTHPKDILFSEDLY